MGAKMANMDSHSEANADTSCFGRSELSKGGLNQLKKTSESCLSQIACRGAYYAHCGVFDLQYGHGCLP